ncbi:MAG: CRISPR-associated endonuclease Cas3'', partial [Thermoguttaceae bacterium]|nr:CRISPR-associated endonuclease Cas3'' [Thermoguttaceae bacterium]
MKNPRNPLDLYARPDAGTDKTRWQRLDAHLRQVANLAAGLDAASETSPLDAPDAAENATRLYPFILGLLHDLGKAHPAFQRYLEESAQAEADGTGEKRRAPIKHSEAGAAWAIQTFGRFLGTLFAYVVAGHHAGLPDYLTDGSASLCNRLQKGGQTTLQQLQRNATERLAPFVAEIEKVAPLLSGDDSDELGRPVGLTQSNLHFFVRFLFSRLVDADRLDSEAFADPETAASRGKFASIPELYAKFNAYMERFAPENLPSTDDANVQKLRNLRADVLTACREKGRNDLRNRLYELTVPTGGGKTLSSLAFALERAQAAGLDRVVYVVPYTSIIEQTAAIFREIFGDANVVEHHSNFDAEETAAKRASQNASKNGPEIDVETTPVSEYALKARLATENWDAPIIVTTNVQFFESLYSAQGSRCRKLWRLERSVVVLDEAQTLPPRLLSPCVAALKALPELFETTLVLCTATQPTLSRLKELAPPNMTTNTPQLPQPTPIIDDASELYATLARVRYVFDENLNPDPSWAENPSVRWAQIATELEACGQIVPTDAADSTNSTNSISPIDSTDLTDAASDATAAQVADVKKRLGLASGDVADVLCVVNTRRDCYDLYEKLKRRDAEAEARAREAGTFDESTAPITLALSALMCGAHRAKVVEQIREILARNRALPPERRRPLRVISTQVIEAGVDVDFPVVF